MKKKNSFLLFKTIDLVHYQIKLDISAKTKHLHLNVTGGKNKRCLQPKLLL